MEDTLKQILNKLNVMEEKVNKMEEKINKIDNIEKDMKEFRTEFQESRHEVKEKLHDMDNRTIILLSDLKGFREETRHEFNIIETDTKLILQQFPEIEKRLEDLEGLKL